MRKYPAACPGSAAGVNLRPESPSWPGQDEGRAMGEPEPYDNPATTQGICSRHQEQVLGASSQSFPDAEMLVVVRPADTDLYEYLLPRFAGVPRLIVILDRRRPDRPEEHKRGREERRIQTGTVSALGYTVVRFKTKPRE
jgi:hypothetical protein